MPQLDKFHHKKNIISGLTTLSISAGIGLIAYSYGDDFSREDGLKTLIKTVSGCFGYIPDPGDSLPKNDTLICLPNAMNATCSFFCGLHQKLSQPSIDYVPLLISGISLIFSSLAISTALFYRFAVQKKRAKQGTSKPRALSSMALSLPLLSLEQDSAFQNNP